MSVSQAEKHQIFTQLHAAPGAFVIANPWDAGSARILSALGFKALATTSAGLAFAAGLRDSNAGISRADLLENAQAIVLASDLPVNGDLEDGFGATPQVCAETIRLAIDCGLVGGSIEDATGDADDPIYDMGLAVDKMAAAAEAAQGQPFILTGRAENFLWGRKDLGDTIRRLQAYAEAGAEVLYAPGLPDLDAIRTVCAEVDKPVNVVMGLSGPNFTVQQLADAGVKRISVGGSFARAALGGMRRAALEVLNQGTFSYAADAIPDAELRQMMADSKPENRD